MRPNRQNTFELNVSVQMNARIDSIDSPSHRDSVNVRLHGNDSKGRRDPSKPSKATISLHRELLLDRDVVLVIYAQGLDRPRCTVERWPAKDGTTDAYALTFVPKVDLPMIQGQGNIFSWV